MLNNYTFIDSNKYEWKEVYSTLKEDFENKRCYETIVVLSGFIYWSIHSKFYRLGTQDSERKTRECVKYVIQVLIPYVVEQINSLSPKLKRNNEKTLVEFDKWLELEDDLYALASYRSLIHYALYMERQDDESQKVWQYNLDECMGGIFHYANSMILNRNYRSMIKQCPTGYGKSKSDCVIITFILGYDINSDIMKIVGNNKLVVPITQNIVNMLLSTKFGKVFPQYGKYEGSKEMFKSCTIGDGQFTLKDSKKALNFACYNKETPIDGSRFNYQFYDDITQSNDKENVVAHKKDRNKYTSQWSKRQYDEYSCIRFFTGTAYHREDFLSWIRKFYANSRPLVKCKIRTKWAKFVSLSEDEKTVYVTVPKLADLNLGESKCYCTFPQKYSKEEALKMLHSSIGAKREFMAMEQQEPLPPESLAFDWVFLQQYEELPDEIKAGRCIVKAIIDPSRFGKDNYACLVFKKPMIEGKSDMENEANKWYLTDCFYQKKSIKYSIAPICDMLARHKCDVLSFEMNTTDDFLMKERMESELAIRGLKKTYINSFYSSKNKEQKISYFRDDIRDKIIFPMQGMYSEDSDMGRAMSDIVNYSFDTKPLNDDGIDCCAMLMENEIKSINSVEVLDIYL